MTAAGASACWRSVQRRVRHAVPPSVRAADVAVFRAVARTEVPFIGVALPRLSRAADRSRLWIAIAALLATVGGRSGRRAGLRGLLAIAISSAVTNLPAKLLAGRQRPLPDAVPEVRRLARVPASTSFPSGHSASAFAFATAVAMERPPLRVPLFGLAGAVAASRVYTGVHYPGDVVVGSLIGIAVARLTARRWPLDGDRPAVGLDVGPSPLTGTDGLGLVVVANAQAGSTDPFGPSDQLGRSLPEARWLEVDDGEDLGTALEQAITDARVVGVVGGDGSISAGAKAAAAAGLPLLVVPGGTLNHLASDLGISDVGASVRAAREGRAVQIDLGDLDGHLFVNAASVGLYPELVAVRERWESRIGKWPAALLALTVVLARAEPLELEIDGRPRRVWFVLFGNGRFVDDGIAPSRRHRLVGDGLDVRLVSAEPRLARSRVAWSMLTGRSGRCRSYERWMARQVTVRSNSGPLRLAADGEAWPGPEHLTVRQRSRALVLLQP
jgi:diacylglycerol kinase family enzyme/membrane-associated phospholipid phosphatase